MIEFLKRLRNYFLGEPDEPVQREPAAEDGDQTSGDDNSEGNTSEIPTQDAMTYAARRASNYAPEATCAQCGETSLRFHLGWTFYPDEVPQGTVQLLPGMPDAQPIPDDGHIVLDQQSGFGIPQGTEFSTLVVSVTDGPTYRFRVRFDLPPIHEPTGLKRRLTNLGLYAGIDEYFGGRALWAMRAFKRIHVNNFARNSVIAENDNVDGDTNLRLQSDLLIAVQNAYGNHPDDVTDTLTVPDNLINRVATRIADAGMFLGQVLKRGSYETVDAANDRDPNPNNARAVWGGTENPEVNATTTGYELCLGVYNEDKNEAPIENKICLPQPVHMLQFALFETGYWLVAGGRQNSQTISQYGTADAVENSNPAGGIFSSLDGDYGRSTHWAVREFQCHAKMERAAVEDVTVTEPLYIQRLITLPAVETEGPARYALDGRVSGSVNANTARAIQDWLDRRYRCPVILYAAPNASRLIPNSFLHENIWRYDDFTNTAPRVFALDYSNYYTIPEEFGGIAQFGEYDVPTPITVGEFTSNGLGQGPVTQPYHAWTGASSAEVSPQTTIGQGGLNGLGLEDDELSTFRVIRAVAHFECYGFLECNNAYDNSGISIGLYHWTLARTTGNSPAQARELGGLMSYAEANYQDGFQNAFGYFGMASQSPWPIPLGGAGTYNSTVSMQTESDPIILCGATPSIEDNKYVKSWHFYYRAQMAVRTNEDWQRAMWGYARLRIQAILDRTFQVGTRSIRIGDYATCEKTVAILLRWHVIEPGYVYGNSHVRNALSGIPQTLTGQAREDAVRLAIVDSYTDHAIGWASNHANEINGWTNVPQNQRGQYQLNLINPVLDETAGSFDFDEP